jgi:hypothetical protein
VNFNDPKLKNSLPNHIDFALVSGEVQAKHDFVSSNYKDEHKGVLKVLEIKQHGKRWNEKTK